MTTARRLPATATAPLAASGEMYLQARSRGYQQTAAGAVGGGAAAGKPSFPRSLQQAAQPPDKQLADSGRRSRWRRSRREAQIPRSLLATLLCLALAWTVAGCSGADAVAVCEAGRVTTCPCAGTAEGTQTCAADGSAWLDCQCGAGSVDGLAGDAGASGPDATSDSDASADLDGPGGADAASAQPDGSPGGVSDSTGAGPAPDAGDVSDPGSAPGDADVVGPAPDTGGGPPPGKSVLKATITSPGASTVIEEGSSLSLIGVVTDSVYDSEDLTALWLSDQLGTLWQGTPDPGGWTQLEHVFAFPMQHKITLRVENPDGDFAEATRDVGVCTYGAVETFDAPLNSATWKTYGSAYWDSGPEGGWLEMTGNVGGQQGAIFNVVDPINPGNIEIHFSIWTGQGINTGADGFAMSVYNVDDVPALEAIIGAAQAGGCLGYGVSGACGSMEVTAFHIEFDTWNNNNDPITDPTPDNHVAITLDGDPGNHYLWAAIPSLEDSQWHDVVVTAQGTFITVTLDDAVVIADDIPAFKFHGGYVGFTGTTGWATNYHRFDNLALLQECLVP